MIIHNYVRCGRAVASAAVPTVEWRQRAWRPGQVAAAAACQNSRGTLADTCQCSRQCRALSQENTIL